MIDATIYTNTFMQRLQIDLNTTSRIELIFFYKDEESIISTLK